MISNFAQQNFTLADKLATIHLCNFRYGSGCGAVLKSLGFYCHLIGKAFRTQAAYRVNILFSLISALVLLLVQASVWTALYAQGQQRSATLREALTFVVLSNFVLYAIRLYPGRRIGDSVYSGELGVDMLRPVNLMALHTGNEIGRRLFSLLTASLPVAVVALLAYGLLPPASPMALAYFLLTGLLGVVVFLLFDAIVGYSAFWLMNNWFMPWFERALITLFGGTIIPLWFYPAQLADVAAFLPFKYIGYMSIDLYLGRVAAAEGWRVVAVQLLWIAVLWGIERLVWRAAQQKITVQGG